jgi:hypothetical protein
VPWRDVDRSGSEGGLVARVESQLSLPLRPLSRPDQSQEPDSPVVRAREAEWWSGARFQRVSLASSKSSPRTALMALTTAAATRATNSATEITIVTKSSLSRHGVTREPSLSSVPHRAGVARRRHPARKKEFEPRSQRLLPPKATGSNGKASARTALLGRCEWVCPPSEAGGPAVADRS